DARVGSGGLRLYLGPATIPILGNVQVWHREPVPKSFELRRLVAVLARIVIAGDNVPALASKEVGYQALAVTPTLELGCLTKRGAHAHRRSTTPKPPKAAANASGFGPM